MKYQFQFSPQAEDDFASIEKSLKKRIFSKLSFWEKFANPLQYSKKLNTLKERYRFRAGDYRIIVTPRNDRKIVIVFSYSENWHQEIGISMRERKLVLKRVARKSYRKKGVLM